MFVPEDFIYRSILEVQNDPGVAIRGVDKFAKAIGKFVDTLEQ